MICTALAGRVRDGGVAPWRVVGRQVTGPPSGARLRPGEAVEIATGAPVPSGCEAVLPYEQAVWVGDLVHGRIGVGRHLRRRGEDIASGTTVGRAGEVMTPALCGLLAAAGCDRVVVRRRPRVAILTTGAEIVTYGVPGAGWVRDTITPMLVPLIDRFGGDVGVRRHVPGWSR